MIIDKDYLVKVRPIILNIEHVAEEAPTKRHPGGVEEHYVLTCEQRPGGNYVDQCHLRPSEFYQIIQLGLLAMSEGAI